MHRHAGCSSLWSSAGLRVQGSSWRAGRTTTVHRLHLPPGRSRRGAAARRSSAPAAPSPWTGTIRPALPPTLRPGAPETSSRASTRARSPRTFLEVLEALLWGFHNSRRSGVCFPSYEAIAAKAECHCCTVVEALKALEWAGVLTWQNRITRAVVRQRDLFGRWSQRWTVIRTSNAYVFRIRSRSPQAFQQLSWKIRPEHPIKRFFLISKACASGANRGPIHRKHRPRRGCQPRQAVGSAESHHGLSSERQERRKGRKGGGDEEGARTGGGRGSR